jgi:hypothetical protein
MELGPIIRTIVDIGSSEVLNCTLRDLYACYLNRFSENLFTKSKSQLYMCKNSIRIFKPGGPKCAPEPLNLAGEPSSLPYM